MARYQVVLAYDGTDFFGFQRQAEARTVQSVFEAALNKLGWDGQSILAAGRTDAGVHARGQVVAFDLAWAHSKENLRSALNAYLPAEVAARTISDARPDFHPRFDAIARQYRYHIFCHPIRDPLRERFAWRVWPPVKIGILNETAAHLVGEHDFSKFGRPMHTDGSTIRTVLRAGWEPDQQSGIRFEIVANAFLYHMVRRLVKVQVSICQQDKEPSLIRHALAIPGFEAPQGLAPPNGLVLEAVDYREVID